MMINAQFIKSPLIAEAKAQRGVTTAFYAVSDYLIAMIDQSTPIDVLPGKDTPVPLQIAALPPNANVESVIARLHVAAADDKPTQDKTAVGITKNNNTADPASGAFQVSVDQPVRPRNVQLKLDGGDVFWSFGGVLNERAYDLPDFTAALNTYLDQANLSAPLTELPFVFKSDSIGKVGIEIVELKYSQVKTQAWPNPLDNTTRVDRNLKLGFGAVERVPLDALADKLDRAVKLRSIKLDIGGEFGPDRLLGSVEMHDDGQFATISGDYSLAQSFILSGQLVKGTCRCTGIICFFIADDKAELYLELQKDLNGYPAAGVPLAKSNLSFEPPDKQDQPQQWTFAGFAAPAELQTDGVYWIVVKGVRGSTRLGLQSAPDGDASTLPVIRDRMYINRGGQIWKSMFRPVPTPPIVALLGVVYLPGSDDQTAAVQIAVTGAPAAGAPIRERIDPGKAPHTIALKTQDINWSQSVLEIRSHAQGTLSIANVIQEYRLA